MKHSTRILGAAMLAGVLLLIPACGDVWLNNTASLGGTVAGGRGRTEIVFDNRTPYRAIFTFGVYDPQDQGSEPQYAQFAVNPDQDETTFNRGLAAETTTPSASFVVSAGRAVSLGGEDLIDRINNKKVQPVTGEPIVDSVLRTGIYFTDTPIDGDDANAIDTYTIKADPVMSLIGVDYQADALLIYHFDLDPDDTTRVLVTLDVIPATSD